MATSLRIGVVGCGNIARAHVTGYQADGQATVVACWDPAPGAAAALAAATGATVAATIAEMIDRQAPDAVSICSPPAAHLDNARPFLEAGIPVLCEKPLEVNAVTAAALAQLVRDTGTLLMPAFCHRFHPPVIELKKLIAAGVLGEPLLFRNIFGGYADLATNHRANPVLSGGGPVIDHCCHSIDLFRHLVGDPTHAQGMAGNVLQNLAIEDFGMFQLAVDDRVFGEITGSYSLKGCGNVVEWYGTKGCATISYFNASQPDLVYVVPGEQDRTVVDCSSHPSRFVGEVAHFLACLRDGATPALTVDDGLKASQVVAAVYAAIATGQRMPVGDDA